MPFERLVETAAAVDPRDATRVMLGSGPPAGPEAASAASGSLWLDRTGPFGAELWQKHEGSGWRVDASTGCFDVRSYGAVADFATSSATSPPTDNSGAFQAAIDAAQAAGGGQVCIPAGQYYMSRGVTITTHGVHIVGAGKYATVIRFEPTAPATAFFFRDAEKPTSTLYSCSLRDLTLWGIERAAPRHEKTAIHLVNTSETLIQNVDVNFWTTSAPAARPSTGLRHAGKELTKVYACTFYADRPISIEANPKEPAIDCDALHLHDIYLGVGRDGESGVHIDPGLHVYNFVMDGTNVIVPIQKDAARHITYTNVNGIYWNDAHAASGTPPGPTPDGTFFKVSGLRTEQMTGTGYSIYLGRQTGALYNVHLEQLNLNFGNNGIYLDGTINTRIVNCAYLQFTESAARRRVLTLTARCRLTVLDQFFVPATRTPFADVFAIAPAQRVTFSVGQFTGDKSFLPPLVIYDVVDLAASALQTVAAPALVVGDDPGYSGATGAMVRLHNVTPGAAPSGTPSAGGILYVDDGALWYVGPSGTHTRLAIA